MSSTMNLAGAGCAALLCLYAISTSRGADPIVPAATQRYAAAVARADAFYQRAQAACEGKAAGERELCFREAKATLLRGIDDARQGLELISARRVAP